jgi:hypothetical protein
MFWSTGEKDTTGHGKFDHSLWGEKTTSYMRSINALRKEDWTKLLEAAKRHTKAASRSEPDTLSEAINAVDDDDPRGLLMSDPMETDEPNEGKLI